MTSGWDERRAKRGGTELRRHGSGMALVLAVSAWAASGCAKGPTEKETALLVTKAVESYIGPGAMQRVRIENVTILSRAKVDGDDWHQDVKYDLVLVTPDPHAMDRSFVGCEERDCRAPHRDSLTLRMGADGWMLAKRDQLP
jgi:hypothetical protein